MVGEAAHAHIIVLEVIINQVKTNWQGVERPPYTCNPQPAHGEVNVGSITYFESLALISC